MGKNLSRREFVGLGAAAVAGAVATGAGTAFDDLAAVGDLDALAGDLEASPAAITPMGEMLHKMLRVYPTELGIEDARLNPGFYKSAII